MKKILTTLSLTSALFLSGFLFVQAATVIDNSDVAECETWLPVESTLCAGGYTMLTYNNPSPEGVVLITLNDAYIHDSGGYATMGFLWCGAGGPGNCTASNVSTDINGWGTIYSGGGAVSPNLSAGTYNISLDVDVYAPGGAECRWYGSTKCKINDTTNNSGGTLTVTAAASVNLQIGSIIDKIIDLFI